MHIKNYDFDNLSFSDLFQTYVTDFKQVDAFYETNPFDNAAIKARASTFTFNGDREKIVETLLTFNQQFDVDEASVANINRLKNDETLAIVTGQQLGVYGGPVFTMYKTLTTIHLARQLEKKLDRPVIPVFWLADEDHDYDEIRSVSILNGEGVESFSLPKKEGGPPPVSELTFPNEIEKLKKQLRSTLIDTDFSENLWALLDDCFMPGESFLKGFGTFISHLFSKYGLVLAGSNNAAVKEQTKEVLSTSIQKADAIRDALESQSQKIEDLFHRQVTLYDSHLFYLDDKKGRIKISRDDEQWFTENGHQWGTDELLRQIDNKPQKFSPDVFFRPILQDKLLPTLGYVAGPGETAYYGQMKTFYRCFSQQMPVIFPRLSGTFIEPAIDRIFRELPFELNEYSARIEDLETSFVDRTEQVDIEAIFSEWKKSSERLSADHEKTIKSIDSTLEGAFEKVQTEYFNELDKLKGKVYRAVKRREETQLNRILRLQRNLFPNRNLQERTLCGIYYMNKFGLDIWDRLLANLADKEKTDTHKLIYL